MTSAGSDGYDASAADFIYTVTVLSDVDAPVSHVMLIVTSSPSSSAWPPSVLTALTLNVTPAALLVHVPACWAGDNALKSVSLVTIRLPVWFFTVGKSYPTNPSPCESVSADVLNSGPNVTEVRSVHPENMIPMSFTFDVFIGERSRDVSEEHPKNIPLMSVTFTVLNVP